MDGRDRVMWTIFGAGRFYAWAGSTCHARSARRICVLAVLAVTMFGGYARGAEDGWFDFAPKADPFTPDSGFDLRGLNEAVAGQRGPVGVQDGRFVLGDGTPVRFWGVNVSPENVNEDAASLAKTARVLAKHGVNLVRIHGGYFKEDGSVDAARVKHAGRIVAAMKAQGIYTLFSTYFPLWLKPRPGTEWLAGYDGQKNPFAALYFNPAFQKKYESWWAALLNAPAGEGGARIADEPAVMGLEIINEDSYFFWTFRADAIPDVELKILEQQFGDWLKHKYGSLDAASARWNREKTPRDDDAAGRMGFRPLWNMANERTARDRDTAAFLTESQRGFYQKTYQYLRGLGFKGVIEASNWATASPQYLGPLEKYTYTACDFLDRHGYFSSNAHGTNDAWAIMKGQTYSDRSALRFDAEKPGEPKQFVNPVIDVHYDGKPSIISETTFNRPNRYRSEAPLFYACYGALQGTNGFVHFFLEGGDWSVKPRYFMQPWTLMSPAMTGQFPAAALIYRQGLVAEGDELVRLNLKIADIENLAGTPLPQDAAFDELRAKDLPRGTTIRPGNVIDPLVHFAGRTRVDFTDQGGPAKLVDLANFVDRKAQRVMSSSGQLWLDYGKGTLRINAPAAQGVSGNLAATGPVQLADVSVESSMPLGHVIAVTLDGKPLAASERILLQVMSEEQNSGWKTEDAGAGTKRIVDIGKDPWQVKALSGVVKFKRADARRMRVTALDFNGYPVGEVGGAGEIRLAGDIVYYLIAR